MSRTEFRKRSSVLRKLPCLCIACSLCIYRITAILTACFLLKKRTLTLDWLVQVTPAHLRRVQWVHRLPGQRPRWDCTHWDRLLSLREHESHPSSLADHLLSWRWSSPIFSPISPLSGASEEDTAGQRTDLSGLSELTLAQIPLASFSHAAPRFASAFHMWGSAPLICRCEPGLCQNAHWQFGG